MEGDGPMGILSSKISNLRFDHAIQAYEGRVRVTLTCGEDEFTARAYLPHGTGLAQVEAALSEVALKRFEALGSPGRRV